MADPTNLPLVAPTPITLPYKIKGGWIRVRQRSTRCQCGTCGEWIKRGEPYARLKGTTRNSYRLFRIPCWRRSVDERDARRMLVVRDPTRRPRANSGRQRHVIEGVPAQIVLHMNVERAHKLREIMEWAKHDRPHAILYNMIDASWARWRARRDAGTLPRKPPPLPPRHFGPHMLKVEGFE